MSGVRMPHFFKRLMKMHSNPPNLYYGFMYDFETSLLQELSKLNIHNKSMVLSLTFFAMISMQCEWLQCNQRLTHLPWLITWWRHPSWSHLPRRESCGHVSLAQLRMRYSYTYTPFYKLSHVQYQHVQTERDEKCKAWFAVTLMYSDWRECSVNLWRFIIIVVYLYVQLQLKYMYDFYFKYCAYSTCSFVGVLDKVQGLLLKHVTNKSHISAMRK